MNSTNHVPNHDPNPGVFTTDPPVALLKPLTVRALQPHEYPQAAQRLDREHYLGELPAGRQLLQAVEDRGQWVALLDWGPAAGKQADREEWIGWPPRQRAERLGLVALKAELYPEPSWPALQERCQHNPPSKHSSSIAPNEKTVNSSGKLTATTPRRRLEHGRP